MAIYGKSKKKSNVVSQKSQFWVFTSMASPAEVLHAERGHQLPAAIGMLSLLCTVNMYTIYIYISIYDVYVFEKVGKNGKGEIPFAEMSILINIYIYI